MGMLVPAVVLVNIVGGFICLGLAVVAWRYRDEPVALPFGALVFAGAIVSFANVAFITSDGRQAAYVADRVVRSAAVHIGPLWLLFVLAYVGRTQAISRRTILALWAYPIAYVTLSVTAPLHGITSTPEDVVMLTTGGITAAYVAPDALSSLTFAFSSIVAGASFLLLIGFLLRSRPGHRKQTLVLIGATVVGITTATVARVGLIPHPGIDVRPFGFVILSIAIGWAILRFDFLRLTPLAEDVLIDELPDPVFVLGEDGRVIDGNPAAGTAFDHDDPSGELLEDVAPGLAADVENDTIYRHVDESADDADVTYYEPNVTALRDQHGSVRGRLIVLRDITGQQRRRMRLEALQEATRRFLGASTAEQVAGITVEYAERSLSCEVAGVFLVDDERSLRPAAMSEHASELFDREELVVAPDDGFAAYKAYERNEHVELALEPDVGGPIQRLHFLPLGGLGIIAAGTTDGEGLPPDEVGFATILARTTHVALERVDRESELRRNRKTLERRTEQIAFFNGVLRHSLRNALLVIEGRAEHLRTSLPESEQGHVDTIARWCADLAELSEDIRSVNDTVTATESKQLDVVDLSALLSDRLEAYEERYPDATFDVDIDEDVRIEANDLARSVVDSIVDNAVVHNDGDRPRVEVWTVRAADRILVHVADNGSGVTDEMKSIVFERSVTPTQTASGFGLYFVSVLMNLYGGNLRFEDNHPEGAIAVLEFQLAETGGDVPDHDRDESVADQDAPEEQGDARPGFDVVSSDGGLAGGRHAGDGCDAEADRETSEMGTTKDTGDDAGDA